ncbi:MAG: lipopolysaccharide biosynthesis protein [Thermoleophilia bacterium]
MKRFIRRFIKESIYINTLYLLFSWVLLSAFGLLFWTICAHLYSDAQMGIATALLAALNLISSLSLMGFELSIIRVLPEHPDKNTLFNVCLSTVTVFGIFFSLLFMVILPHFHSDLDVVTSSIATRLLFILFVLISVSDYMFNNTFIAYRKSKFNLRKNLVFSVGKLIFPFFLIAFGAYGILSSWMFSLGAAVIYSMVVLSRRFNHSLMPRLGIAPLRGMIRYSFGNYLASFVEGLPVIVLPILIINVYGPEMSAYYYIAMMFATFLFTISASATQSLLAEASHGGVTLTEMIGKVLKFLGLLLVPGIIFLMVLSPYLLRVFGSSYAAEATGLLRILAVAAVVNAFNSIARTIFRINYRTLPLTVISFFGAVLIISFSYFFRGYGLNGVGYAKFLGEAVSLVCYGALIFLDRRRLLLAAAPRYSASNSST